MLHNITQLHLLFNIAEKQKKIITIIIWYLTAQQIKQLKNNFTMLLEMRT